MKIFRPAATAAALTASMVVSASVQAADNDAGFAHLNDTSMVATADDAISVARTYEQIRADVATAEFTGDEMLSRIDGLVIRIDALISTADAGNFTSAANTELVQLRTATLQMRSEVVEFLAGDGSQLVQITTPLPPVQGVMPSVGGEFVTEPVLGQPSVSFGGSVPGSSVAASGGGGGGAIAGGAGGGVLGSGGGFFGILGATGAAAAVGFSDDNDNAGPIASQFAP